jgi:DNA-binding CsgD family transcriptional regulator
MRDTAIPPRDGTDESGALFDGTPASSSAATPIRSHAAECQVLLSRFAQLRASLREGVLDMRATRRDLEERRGELKACRQALHRAYGELRDRLLDRSSAPVATRQPPPVPAKPNGILGRLSPRQRRVLEGVLAGKANKTIAFDLGVSTKTVETHRARVMMKLAVESFAELVRVCTLAGARDWLGAERAGMRPRRDTEASAAAKEPPHKSRRQDSATAGGGAVRAQRAAAEGRRP